MEKPHGARLLHQRLVLYQRLALYWVAVIEAILSVQIRLHPTSVCPES